MAKKLVATETVDRYGNFPFSAEGEMAPNLQELAKKLRCSATEMAKWRLILRSWPKNSVLGQVGR